MFLHILAHMKWSTVSKFCTLTFWLLASSCFCLALTKGSWQLFDQFGWCVFLTIKLREREHVRGGWRQSLLTCTCCLPKNWQWQWHKHTFHACVMIFRRANGTHTSSILLRFILSISMCSFLHVCMVYVDVIVFASSSNLQETNSTLFTGWRLASVSDIIPLYIKLIEGSIFSGWAESYFVCT
jgi:hypothetical protein